MKKILSRGCLVLLLVTGSTLMLGCPQSQEADEPATPAETVSPPPAEEEEYSDYPSGEPAGEDMGDMDIEAVPVGEPEAEEEPGSDDEDEER